MIKSRLIRESGHLSIDCLGHAKTHVCSAASMIMQSAALGLRDLAKQYPGEVEFTGFICGLETDDIHSYDKRKRARRKK